MDKLNQYFALQNEIFDYFGYVEDWRILPMDDATEYFWILDQDSNGSGNVRFAGSEDELSDGDYYENEIYTQRHLQKWVYRGEEFTMIVVDTHTDSNQFLQIFRNSKERKYHV